MKHKIARKQINAKSCLVCGYENDFGLHMSFTRPKTTWSSAR